MADYRRPVLAYGQTALKTATAAVSAGDTTISLDNSGGEYTAGSHVFVCSASNADYQYLGAATAATATTVTVPVAVATTLGLNAKVWQPTAIVTFTRGPGPNVVDRRPLGVTVRRSRGGVGYSTQTADDSHYIGLRWEKDRGMEPSDYNSIFSFFEAHMNYGQKALSLGYWHFPSQAYKVSTARYAWTDPELRTISLEAETGYEHPDRATVALEFLIESEDGYAI